MVTMTRTERSLVACVKRYEAEKAKKEALIVRLRQQEYSLADIKNVLEAAGATMSRSGIRGVLHRHGIDTSV
jgi:DNA-binding transcriptional regulator WhiA